jgi:hypothetical protein
MRKLTKSIEKRLTLKSLPVANLKAEKKRRKNPPLWQEVGA